MRHPREPARDVRARLYTEGGLKRLSFATSAFLAILLISSTGFWVVGQLHYRGLIEPSIARAWTPFECLYMTVITVSTIGYSETLPVDPGQSLDDFPIVRGYTMGVILIAMLLVGYSVSSATAFLIEGDLLRYWQTRQALRKAARMQGHYILCGVGVTGSVILDELTATKHKVVAIDLDPARLAELREKEGVIPLEGDATSDKVLVAAGIEKAVGLAAALPSDKDNVFLIVTARQLRRDGGLRIVSLASSQEMRDKLVAVGADGVVSGSYIGGLRLASELFRPTVVTFLDGMLRARGDAVRFAEIEVGEVWSGKTVGELDLTGRLGLPLLAIGTAGKGAGALEYNPPADRVLRAREVVVTMGAVEMIRKAQVLLGEK